MIDPYFYIPYEDFVKEDVKLLGSTGKHDVGEQNGGKGFGRQEIVVGDKSTDRVLRFYDGVLDKLVRVEFEAIGISPFSSLPIFTLNFFIPQVLSPSLTTPSP